MEIVGRLTDQATVKTTNAGKELVSFTVAVNESYKKSGEWVRKATYFNCAYWRTTAIAQHLTKAAVVKVAGSIGMNVWNDASGAARGSLTMNVGSIDILTGAKKGNTTQAGTSNNSENVDDLPF